MVVGKRDEACSSNIHRAKKENFKARPSSSEDLASLFLLLLLLLFHSWLFLPSPVLSFLASRRSFGDNCAAFIKITTVALTRPLMIAANIVNKVGAKRIVTRGDTRVQEQRCLIIDDTIDSRRCESYSRARTCGRIYALYTLCAKSYQLDERRTSDRKLRGDFLFAVRFRDREIFFGSSPVLWQIYFDYMGIDEPASASRQFPAIQYSRSISAFNKFPFFFYVISL